MWSLTPAQGHTLEFEIKSNSQEKKNAGSLFLAEVLQHQPVCLLLKAHYFVQ